MAQTPLKKVWRIGALILTEDTAGGLEVQAVAESDEKADWLVWSICRAHNVSSGELREFILGRDPDGPLAVPAPGAIKARSARLASLPRPTEEEITAAGIEMEQKWRREGPSSFSAQA